MMVLVMRSRPGPSPETRTRSAGVEVRVTGSGDFQRRPKSSNQELDTAQCLVVQDCFQCPACGSFSGVHICVGRIRGGRMSNPGGRESGSQTV